MDKLTDNKNVIGGGVEWYQDKIIDAIKQIDNKIFLNRILISLTEYIKETKPE